MWFVGMLIMVLLVVGFVVLFKQVGRPVHPLLQRLRERGIKPKKIDLLLCRRPAFVSAGQLMTARERRFLSRLERVLDKQSWRVCPQVRVADIVRISTHWKTNSREWWQLFRLVSQWHCDVVITHRKTGQIVAAVELDDRTHQAKHRQRRDLVLEEVLRQANIPLLRGENEVALVESVAAHVKDVQTC
ncbi:DUF2726 domain-containing protein [Yersinia enterocolitica]|uniref:DUF2726 domain-containing protein n=1 Tax=Yersinia enterocolitica TaxID=630 RepID=UPI001C8DC995|nr:DUF2726 domain-containing protein [Yersinia enterocolitica]MBX9475259.1 DUF2726 domain-containing protein [Yersinia enterocolitica]